MGSSWFIPLTIPCPLVVSGGLPFENPLNRFAEDVYTIATASDTVQGSESRVSTLRKAATDAMFMTAKDSSSIGFYVESGQGPR